MTNGLRWAWLVLAVVALAILAHMTRYRVVEDAEGGAVWDRWRHRYCYEQDDGSIDCGSGDRRDFPGAQSS